MSSRWDYEQQRSAAAEPRRGAESGAGLQSQTGPCDRHVYLQHEPKSPRRRVRADRHRRQLRHVEALVKPDVEERAAAQQGFDWKNTSSHLSRGSSRRQGFALDRANAGDMGEAAARGKALLSSAFRRRVVIVSPC